MKEEFSDQRLEAIFSKLSVADTQKLKCPQGNEVNKLCINSECENALLCSEDTCNSCGDEVHPICPQASLASVKKCLNSKAKQHKEFLYAIFELENKFINQIYQNRAKMIKEYEYNFVEFDYRGLLIEIFEKKNNKALNGQKAQQFHCYLRDAQEQKQAKTNQWKQWYQTYLEEVQAQMVSNNQLFFEAFAEKPSFIDSNILMQKSKNQVVQMNFLEQSLGEFTKIELIFRGSEHDFSAKCFHAHCDHVQNTLTLVKTQQGKTVAGFTKAMWGGDGNKEKQKSKEAFLLQLNNLQKYVSKVKTRNIIWDTKWGPIFGTGGKNCDLAISDNCQFISNSSSNFPATFNRESGEQLKQNNESCQAFIGANNDQVFLVEEYEVFKVTYQ